MAWSDAARAAAIEARRLHRNSIGMTEKWMAERSRLKAIAARNEGFKHKQGSPAFNAGMRRQGRYFTVMERRLARVGAGDKHAAAFQQHLNRTRGFD